MIAFLKEKYRILRGIYIYFSKIILRKSNKIEEEKLIFFDLNHNRFERYLFLLCKFYLLEGYQIGIKVNFSFLGNLERYSALLLNEKNVHFFLKSKNTSVIFHTNPKKEVGIFLSDNYFSDPISSSYHIPMSQHPLMYQDNFWNKSLSNDTMNRAIFFAGSLEKGHYDREEMNSIFGVYNRVQIGNFLHNSKYWYPINQKSQLDVPIVDKIVFLDRAKINIPMPKLRQTLSRFRYFLACPGVSMPFSHNVIEAMSVGCIPILEDKYADLFQPKLEHLKNSFIFSQSEKNLEEIIDFAFNQNDALLNLISQNVLTYYNNYLTPKNVIETISKNKYSTCFLNAEAFSVKYLSNNTFPLTKGD
jgi:hypothetical protein